MQIYKPTIRYKGKQCLKLLDGNEKNKMGEEVIKKLILSDLTEIKGASFCIYQ